MLLSNRVQGISLSIAQYQDQISELQAKIGELQKHQQECEGVSASCENALEQLRVALNLVRAICPEEEHTLRNAVETLFSPAILEGRTEVEAGTKFEDADVEVEAVNLDVEAGTKVEDANVEDANVEDVVNVEAINVEDTNVEDVEDVNVEERDSRRFLLSLTKAKLLDIAKTKGIKISSSKTKEEIVNLLLKEIQASGI